MAENFRAWFERTRGMPFPGIPGEHTDTVFIRVMAAVADWTEHVTAECRRGTEPQEAKGWVQRCRVENHSVPGRAADLLVIAEDTNHTGDRNLAHWVKERLNIPTEAAAVAEKPKPEPANTRLFVVICRHGFVYVIGPFAASHQVEEWALAEYPGIPDDPRWHFVIEVAGPIPPVPVYLSASQHPPRD